MHIKTEKQANVAANAHPFHYARKISIFTAFLLLLLSILIASCGASSGTTVQASNAEPKPTATIQFNNNNLSPIPTLPPVWCGIWVMNESPYYTPGGTIDVYGKFSANTNGNPVAISGANVTITVQWGDLQTSSLPATTTATGLVTQSFPMGSHAGAVDKLSLITAQFNSTSGNQSCSVDATNANGNARPASFTLIQGAPTATPTRTGGGGGKRHNPIPILPGLPGFPGFPGH
ncbi:hypothetical protein ccbrp13_67400 [Ktedonobacteria bacterium brp13]|nr:hypothetical protein ccbrp13_67400 [Ktedonobacteria bacterium brp13]